MIKNTHFNFIHVQLSPRKSTQGCATELCSRPCLVQYLYQLLKDPEFMYTKFMSYKAEKGEYCNRCRNKELKADQQEQEAKPKITVAHINVNAYILIQENHFLTVVQTLYFEIHSSSKHL